MQMSHMWVLLFALAAGLIIGAKQPGLVSTLTLGTIKAA